MFQPSIAACERPASHRPNGSNAIPSQATTAFQGARDHSRITSSNPSVVDPMATIITHVDRSMRASVPAMPAGRHRPPR